ncbi:MAG: hypothetical protein OEW62_02325 [Candidatus Bathyarchaeota archaeon]|nr:hypothetical protein [Candidatus Bathyarchaeota archaeon]MDH5734172.1 hypothetical protein [Candidatus Bathyarchaeota archaeon]
MPNKRVHLKFDEYLKDHGIIRSYTYADSVHDRMDRGIIVLGSEHRDIDFYHSEKGIREWLRGFSHLAYQETLTDYLRVALGHLALDGMASRYEFENEYGLMKSAYRSFIQQGYHRKYFLER